MQALGIKVDYPAYADVVEPITARIDRIEHLPGSAWIEASRLSGIADLGDLAEHLVFGKQVLPCIKAHQPAAIQHHNPVVPQFVLCS